MQIDRYNHLLVLRDTDAMARELSAGAITPMARNQDGVRVVSKPQAAAHGKKLHAVGER